MKGVASNESEGAVENDKTNGGASDGHTRGIFKRLSSKRRGSKEKAEAHQGKGGGELAIPQLGGGEV
jgi:hypothetical protein